MVDNGLNSPINLTKAIDKLPLIEIQSLDNDETFSISDIIRTNEIKKSTKATIEMFTDINKETNFRNLSRATLDGFNPRKSSN